MANTTMKIQLSEDLNAKLQGACSELASLNPNFKHTPESLTVLMLEMMEYDDICEKALLFQDKILRQQIEEIKKMKSRIKTKDKISEEVK